MPNETFRMQIPSEKLSGTFTFMGLQVQDDALILIVKVNRMLKRLLQLASDIAHRS